MADVFEDRPELVEWRDKLFSLIDETPNLDWLLLTKRVENIERMLPERWACWSEPFGHKFPVNVWLGITAETQHHFDTRWPVLESLAYGYHPMVVFLSLEPLLGPMDIAPWLDETDVGDEDGSRYTRPPDWVIAGAESGPSARSCDLAWVRALRDQCVTAGVPFFWKQHIVNGRKVKMPELDGRVWTEYPAVARPVGGD